MHILSKYNQNVPRYTSYPTAPHFSASITGSIYEQWLKLLPKDEEISLYLHIPFCKQLCWYCGCHTKITNRYAPVEEYTYILKREIKLISDILGSKRKVSQIHFGGGSPTIVQPDDFKGIIDTLKQNFLISNNANIAIEIDPRNISEAKVAAYAKSGITRISLGVQDFHENVQKAINRIQPFNVVYDAVKLLREYGIDNIGMDLIYGLPGQSIESIKENINYALLLKPSRIALFGYAHVPWKKKHMRLINESSLPDADLRTEMFQIASAKLRESGYIAVGLDHFVHESDDMAKSYQAGELKRNFQGYEASSCDNIIGLGISAISTMPQGYVQNCLEVENYKRAVLSNKTAILKGIAINDEDRLRREIINQLMCYMHVDISAICKKYNTDPAIFKNTIEELQPLVNDRLISINNYNIDISGESRQIVRVVCSKFDSYFNSQVKDKHSQI